MPGRFGRVSTTQTHEESIDNNGFTRKNDGDVNKQKMTNRHIILKHQKKASHFQRRKKRHVQYFVHQRTEIAGFIKTGPRRPDEAQCPSRRQADRVAEESFWSPGRYFCNRLDILALSGGRWGSTATQKPNCSGFWVDTVWPRHAQESPGDANNSKNMAKGMPRPRKSK